MNVAIVGIGGVGGYFGGKLARRYANTPQARVTFIARGEHLQTIRQSGLQQITDEGTWTVTPDTATDTPADCGPFDLVLFCVKAYDLDSSIRMLRDSVTPDTAVISLLNGVDNGQRLKAAYPDAHVLNGCAYLGAHIVRPGVVRQKGGSCRLFYGSEYQHNDRYTAIESFLKEAAIAAEYRRDIRTVVWEKYVFIDALAGATTYTGHTLGRLLDDNDGRNLLHGLLDEVLALAVAEKAGLPDNIRDATLKKLTLFPPETKSSLQMDFQNGRRTEIDTLAGHVVRQSRHHGLPVPLHERVYEYVAKSTGKQQDGPERK